MLTHGASSPRTGPTSTRASLGPNRHPETLPSKCFDCRHILCLDKLALPGLNPFMGLDFVMNRFEQ